MLTGNLLRNSALKKPWIFQHLHPRQVKMFLFVSISLVVCFGVCIYMQSFFDIVRKQPAHRKYPLKLIKGRSKVHQKDMSHGHALNFYQ